MRSNKENDVLGEGSNGFDEAYKQKELSGLNSICHCENWCYYTLASMCTNDEKGIVFNSLCENYPCFKSDDYLFIGPKPTLS